MLVENLHQNALKRSSMNRVFFSSVIALVQSFFKSPNPTLMAFTGVTNAHGPSPHPTACRSPSCSLTTATGSNQATKQGLNLPPPRSLGCMGCTSLGYTFMSESLFYLK